MSEAKHLRQRILRYLLDQKRASGSMPDPLEIGQSLGEPDENIKEQLEILESMGAIDAGFTFGSAAPMLLGAGMKMLEELEEENLGISTTGASKLREREASTSTSLPDSQDLGDLDGLQLFEQTAADIIGGSYDLLQCFRRSLYATRLLGWGDQWLAAELNGYTTTNTPEWRVAIGSWDWLASEPGDIISLQAKRLVNPDASLNSSPTTTPLSYPLAELIRLGESGLALMTGDSKSVRVGGKSIDVSRTLKVKPEDVQVVLDQLAEKLFDFASSGVAALGFGSHAASVFHQYQSSVDQKTAELGVSEHLKAAYMNIRNDNPASWQAAALACRNVIYDVASKLWQVPGGSYPYLTDESGRPLSVRNDKQLNRLRAYLHQKGALRKRDRLLKAQLEWLANFINALHGEASAAKDPVDLGTAQSVLLNTYIFLGEMVRLTDMRPISELTEV